jgi:putative transcriptional regulator
MVTEHHGQGSMGVVLNKRSELSLKSFGEQLGFDLDMPGFVYQGGPVNTKNLSFLHSNEWVSTNTMRINETFSVSSAEDILPRLSMGDKPLHWRIFLGIAGWSPGQLLSEIKGESPWNHSTSWCVASADLDTVFGSDQKEQWCTALDRSGAEFAQNILL